MTSYGQFYPVGNGKINIYTEGSGIRTIVFLAGSGVTSPALEYRPLYRRLSDEYKIVVVEKSGYGLSESTGTKRSVQNMVSESHQALQAAGIVPPYILAPHSYSGFEAVYWANTYPEEISGVFSIDMGLPETALEMDKVLPPEKKSAMNERNKKLYGKIQRRGLLAKLLRNKTVNVSGMMTSDYLTSEEKALYEELFYRNLTNPEIFEESMMMTENARAAEATGLLSVPAFFYISDMKVPLKGTSWRKLAVEYAEKIGAEYRLTDKGHLMYAEIPDKMAEDFRLFMQRINI